MYKLTAKLLQDKYVKEQNLLGQVSITAARLSALMDALSNQREETVQEKRKKARLRSKIQESKTECDSFLQELKEIQILIRESELETEEAILEQKFRAEALIVVYLDGGGYPLEGGKFELLGDRPAKELYRRYTGEREQAEQIEEREVDAYVI